MFNPPPQKRKEKGERIVTYGSQLKLTKIPATSITHAKDIGKKTFQPNLINWSYRYLGNAARTHTNKKRKKTVLAPNQKRPGIH